MTSFSRVLPQEANALMTHDAFAYVDVRTEQEFEAGHPKGAYNVPLMHMAPGGMVANADYVRVVSNHFDRDAKLIVGCKAGGRSMRAAELLVSAGFVNVMDQRAGFDGVRDGFGEVTEPGWSQAGLPIERGQPAGRNYRDLEKQTPSTA